MDDTTNKQLATRLLGMDGEKDVIEETNEYILFKVGNNEAGHITLIDKHKQRVDYWVYYEAKSIPVTGNAVTQVALWRRLGSLYVVDVTKRVFFDYLLKHWHSVMSDGSQTEQGKYFWMDVMGRAEKKGLKVSFVNLDTGVINWFDNTVEEYEEWIDRHQYAWGRSSSHKSLRFLITNER